MKEDAFLAIFNLSQGILRRIQALLDSQELRLLRVIPHGLSGFHLYFSPRSSGERAENTGRENRRAGDRETSGILSGDEGKFATQTYGEQASPGVKDLLSCSTTSSVGKEGRVIEDYERPTPTCGRGRPLTYERRIGYLMRGSGLLLVFTSRRCICLRWQRSGLILLASWQLPYTSKNLLYNINGRLVLLKIFEEPINIILGQII